MSPKCDFWEPSTPGENYLVVTSAEGQGMEMSGVSFSSFPS